MNSTLSQIQVDPSRDDLLTEFGKSVLKDRYLLDGEHYQDMFTRTSLKYSDNAEHAQRMYDYQSKLWMLPATPILSNGGTKRGLPISCFLNETEDSLDGIVSLWNENVWLASSGGGIGSYWGNLRSIGESVKGRGKTSGIIPFIVVQNALTLAISQGSLRRGSSAVYLQVSHPEIEEFLDIRKPIGGDPSRKALNIHHGIVISDKFMRAVENNEGWELTNPHTNEPTETISARGLWQKILTLRAETGEPYIIFSDTVNEMRPEAYKRLGLTVKMSNLCTEISLTTGKDHKQMERTAVCCLCSLNLAMYDQWKDDPNFIPSITRFMDNVMTDFIERAPEKMNKAKYSAMRERSIGIGVMGFHSLLQSRMIPFESQAAKTLNKIIFSHIKNKCNEASRELAIEKGSCPDAADAGLTERFIHKLSIAPTASISIIAGNTSPGIEPYVANIFTHKTLSGSHVVRNLELEKLLTSKDQNKPEVWSSITENSGSVQHLEFLSDLEKSVFKTAYEIDQRWIIEHASDRTPYICQSQSVNFFLMPNVHKSYLHRLHMLAWKKKLKTLYYNRSQAAKRQDANSSAKMTKQLNTPRTFEYEECLACQ